MTFGFVQAHGTAMILSWMIFGSIGVSFARYGRSIRLGNRRQLLGKAVWFQCHRSLLSITPLLTLLGFLIILVNARGTWVSVNVSDKRRLVHSIFGGSIVCSVMVQMWLALYRCHPNSRYRFIFAWSHRFFGIFTYGLSVPTIFLILSSMSKNRLSNLIIISTWTTFNVIMIITYEIIEYKLRLAIKIANNNNRVEPNDEDKRTRGVRIDIEAGPSTNIDNARLNCLKLLMLFIQTIVNSCLSILLIIFITS